MQHNLLLLHSSAFQETGKAKSIRFLLADKVWLLIVVHLLEFQDRLNRPEDLVSCNQHVILINRDIDIKFIVC